MAQAAATTNNRSMISRQGRSKQRYGPLGERLVAGVVPLSADRTRVLLIQSTSRTSWVLPKGGWETDERTASDAAIREAWEEAGISCRITRDLGQIRETVPPPGQQTGSLYQFYEVVVDREEENWPEMHRRSRMWMTFQQAESALAQRPELLEALRRSTMTK